MTKCQVGVVVLATFGFAVALSNSIDAEACPSSSRSLMQVERGLRHRAQKCTFELNATDKKCAHEHPDRLFREEGHNTSTCYEQCKATANCHYFSISLSDQYAGVCMGCIEGVVETHAPFQFYSMCTTMTTTVAGAGLSGMVGGLQVMYYYLETAPKTVDVLDGLVADITSTVSQINYAPVGTAWSGLEESDRFGAKWTGGLRITTGGVYTLELRSDDGSVLMLDGAVVIDNDGLHGMRTKTVDLELSAGDHPLVVKFFENGGIAGAIFSYSGPDTNDEEVVVPSSVLVTPAGVEPPTTTTTTAIALSDMVGGLQVEYYYFDHGLQTVSVINDVVADVTSTVSQINYAPVRTAWSGLTQSDKFGAKWTGGLRITTAGVYTLDLNSDDGSVLMLDGAVVIDNDGLHGMRTKTVDIELSAGDHPLVVKFFENGGIAGVILKYSGPDTGDEDVVVPGSALLTPAGVDPPPPYMCPADPLANIVSTSDYCEIPEVNRMECGWSGISQAVCEARGCCFRLKEGGPEIPECYCAVDSQSTTTTTKPWSCPAEPIEHIDSSQPYCSIPEEGRQDCGWPYITQQLCEYRGCCWNDFNIAGGDEIPRCFCATNAGDALLQNATALRK